MAADRAGRPRGRRPSGEDTRAALLAAARAVFTERGFDGATVRGIAEPLAALIRSVAGHEAAARMMREFVGRVILGRFVRAVAPDRPEERAALCASQIIGLGMVRYVLKLEPLASAEPAVVVAAIAPTVQRYLTGPID